ncbi:MAG TPA: hypothetical protein VFG59_04390 [Anaeromyxobacter sp.]|nr:hypothetical protein [Anaeromyxobacter sp.]
MIDYDARCARALDQALAHVPAYRSWRTFDPGMTAPIEQRFRALPALTKELMNLHAPAAFVPAGQAVEHGLAEGEVEIVTTSGSTEDKVENLWYQPWWDRSERASWQLNAQARRVATGTHREAILVSPLNVGIRSERALPMEARRLGRFLYLNEFVDPLAWPESHFRRMLEELAIFRPAVLEANPSFLARVCRFATRAGVRPFQPALITLTYEFPSLLHRRQIREVFDAPVVSSYGTTEAGYVFMECERGQMHQNTECCRVDFLPLAAEYASRGLGKLLITTFDNPWRSLIRFDGGDLGRLAEGLCPCGRGEGLTLSSVEGRTVNLTTTPAGKLITQAEVDRFLAGVEGLDEYQLRQADERSYTLKVVTEDEGRVMPQAERALRECYGPEARIEVSPVGALGPEASGKFRLVRASSVLDSMSYVEPGFRPPLPPELRPRDE